MKARVKFAKRGVMKYVGHLDLMRYFQKAMRRARIPIKYSEGFNPHQLMSFAAPLGVGITSEGEYMDIELREEITPDAAVRALNDTMVEGMEVLSFSYLPDRCENAMASLSAAGYELRYKKPELQRFSLEELSQGICGFYTDAPAIVITKKTKKGERELDLRPLIYRFEVSEQEKNSSVAASEEKEPCFSLLVSTGSTDNIKPELVMEHFHRFLGCLEEETPAMDIRRLDMFTKKGENLVSLGEIS